MTRTTRGRSRVVGEGHVAPAHERQSHGGEVARQYGAVRRHRRLARKRGRPPLDGVGKAPDVARDRNVVDRADGRGSRDRGEAIEDLAVEGRPQSGRRVAGARDGDLERHDARRVPAGVDRLQGEEAPRHQAGADQQDDRDRDLGGDEDVAQAAALAPGPGAASFVERVLEPDGGGLERGRESEEDARDERDGEGGEEDARVQAHLGQARDAFRGERHEDLQRPRPERRAGHAAGHREDERLREELADRAPAAGAEGRAQRDLPLPRRGPGEEHVGDVRAGDREDEADGGEQDEQRRPHVADDLLEKRRDRHVRDSSRGTRDRARR